jgi:MFS family permease
LRTSPRSSVILAILWAASLFGFACVKSYPLALVLLFGAGFFELSFSSMTQAIVQLNAPDHIRGRVLGLFNMSALGLRAFSGILVGLVGSGVGTHVSLAAACAGFALLLVLLLFRLEKSAVQAREDA